MEIIISEAQLKKIIESEKDKVIKCKQCGWKWKESEGGKDKYKCHQCGHDNSPKSKFGQPKSISCRNCGKKFTQTTHKKKKSLPICPRCLTHNNEHK